MHTMMYKLLVLAGIFILCIGMSGCTRSNPGKLPTTDTIQVDTPVTSPETPHAVPNGYTLTVFAAASLTGAFQEIGREFEAANPLVRVNFNFAGSQILRTQLEQGALADVFASADHKNMDLLVADKLVTTNAIQDFATNSLIVILPQANPGKLSTLKDLAKPRIKIVLADASVPAGDYARQVLAKMSQDANYGLDFGGKVLANVVSNETDVKQVVAKVELGEADAAIVYTSDAVADPKLLTLPIPANFNLIAIYPMTVLTNAPEPWLAADFVNYVTSAAGQAILARWGFNPTMP